MLLALVGPQPADEPKAIAPADQWTGPEIVTARLDLTTMVSDPLLGAAQGVAYHDGKLYIYGDRYKPTPRRGVIREYTLKGDFTGREIDCGPAPFNHPTGLTWSDRYGCFLGFTVKQPAGNWRASTAIILQVDWPRALIDGHLRNAIFKRIEDDAAINGCRPQFVSIDERVLLATSDYGDVRPSVRIYDVARMLEHGRTSKPGVITHTFLTTPYTQNLWWDATNRQLIAVQNVVAGRGWRLTAIDLEKAVKAGRACPEDEFVDQVTFEFTDELEGFARLPNGLDVFVTAQTEKNIRIGTIEPVRVPTSAPTAEDE